MAKRRCYGQPRPCYANSRYETSSFWPYSEANFWGVAVPRDHLEAVDHTNSHLCVGFLF
jgi:hypothetical protein